MTSATVTVALSFFFPPDVFVPEGELPGLDRSRLGSVELQEGGLQITCGDTVVDLSDALLWMVPGLCLDGMVALRDGGTHALDFWASDERITLQRDGDEIELSGAYQEPVRFPAAAFETAMFGVGERFVDLVAALWPNRSDAEVTYLDNRLAAARLALSKG